MIISYEEYLEKTDKENCVDSWIDWKVEICGMSYVEARKSAYDPEWGFEA